MDVYWILTSLFHEAGYTVT